MKQWVVRWTMLLSGACFLVLAGGSFGASVMDEGRAAYEKGEYKTAIEKWQILIDEGRPEGLFFMAVMYAEGKGVERNHVRAHQLYLEAAQKEHVSAQYNLGNQFAMGEGVARDFAKAEYWWSKAAESGLVRAQLNLGNFYFFGVTGEKNPVLARKWLILAANQGNSDAKETLDKLDAEAPVAAAAPAPATQTAAAAPVAPPAQDPGAPPDAGTPLAESERRSPPEAASPASAHTLRREAWVLAQPAGHFTIQVLATGTDALAQEFIRKNGLAAGAAFIESTSQGNSVFRVLHGSYPSREQAEKALVALPRAISANSPWVRAFAEIHKLVDRRYAQRGATQ